MVDSILIQSELNVLLLANPNISLHISLDLTLIIKHILAHKIMMFDTLSLVGYSYFYVILTRILCYIRVCYFTQGSVHLLN